MKKLLLRISKAKLILISLASIIPLTVGLIGENFAYLTDSEVSLGNIIQMQMAIVKDTLK